MIYFEDLEIGKPAVFGTYDVTREEVLEFARKYDPQPFHLSDEAAAKTHFGRIAAAASIRRGFRPRTVGLLLAMADSVASSARRRYAPAR